jgi:outer membrane protein assembly factor BamC
MARLSKDSAGAYVAVDEAFDRAWRRVGLALDRGGFTVEDRDRNRGLYFVRYVDQGSDAQNKASEPGFFSRLFGTKDEKKSALRYRVMVKSAGEASRITVLDDQGVQTTNANADRILNLLNDQLK